MRILKALLVALLTLAWAPGAWAAENAVGFTVGASSGSGFTYRYYSDEGIGLQVTTLFISSTGSTYSAMGVQLLLPFQKVGWGRLYGLAGAGVYQGMSPLVGAGPGIEIGGDRGATLAIELPIVAFSGIVLPIPNVSYLFRF